MIQAEEELWIYYRKESANADGDVMKDLADGTGGAFFHNNNDLRFGFARLTDAKTKAEIEDAVFSRENRNDIPVVLQLSYSKRKDTDVAKVMVATAKSARRQHIDASARSAFSQSWFYLLPFAFSALPLSPLRLCG